MNSQTKGLRVASVIFAFMAISHVVRIVMHPEVIVAGQLVPLWPSAVISIFLGALSVWMWKLTRTDAK